MDTVSDMGQVETHKSEGKGSIIQKLDASGGTI